MIADTNELFLYSDQNRMVRSFPHVFHDDWFYVSRVDVDPYCHPSTHRLFRPRSRQHHLNCSARCSSCSNCSSSYVLQHFIIQLRVKILKQSLKGKIIRKDHDKDKAGSLAYFIREDVKFLLVFRTL